MTGNRGGSPRGHLSLIFAGVLIREEKSQTLGGEGVVAGTRHKTFQPDGQAAAAALVACGHMLLVLLHVVDRKGWGCIVSL